jgi:general secretion pathway protein F
MTRFVLVGLNSRGELQQLDLVAANRQDAEQEAARSAKQASLQVIEIYAAKSGRAGLVRHRTVSALLQRNGFDIALFVYELLALLRAGLALSEALETLDERWGKNQAGASTGETGHYVLAELIRQMQQGKSFSTALSAHPTCFSGLFVAMAAASEQTGEMVQTLERFLQYHSQVNVVRQKFIAASLYPAVLLLTGIAVAFFLVWFLAPRFGQVYEGMSRCATTPLSAVTKL